ncbi:MAG: hypothetical protein IPM68_09730 [Flavobacteriales bacterium]|nr:hypothetical protein [Flavobacteriales bacterium]
MDARERYDPEDLEALLSERAFDELLAEERAFVLRHVADRAEYETLRATLAQVRAEGRPGPPVAADPEVRDRVLAAFRDARRPAWRIWLNSVGTWLAPPSPAQYWRPVLAFGTLALLIAVGVALWMPPPGLEQEGLAELKPVALPTKPEQPARSEQPAVEPLEEQKTTTTGVMTVEPTLTDHSGAGLTSEALAEVPTTAEDAVTGVANADREPPAEDLAFSRQAATAPATTATLGDVKQEKDQEPGYSREVTAAEVASKAKARRKASGARR